MKRTETPCRHLIGAVASLAFIAIGPSPGAGAAERITRDLAALYDFDESSGDTAHDRRRGLHLRIDKPSHTQWRDGALIVKEGVTISSAAPAKGIIGAVKRSGELSIEAWVRPNKGDQSGPARIVSLSQNTVQRNVTLGQDGPRYDVRLRTASTSDNGLPSTSSPNGSLKTELTHIVYTRDKGGQARIYINGRQAASNKVGGDLNNWRDDFRLILANELTGERPWLGELHLVAIYTAALSAKEVEQNFNAGAGGKTAPAVVKKDPDPKPAPPQPTPPQPAPTVNAAAKHFETQIAPLLAKNCLECHGWKSTKARLDLSKKATALAGGKSGKAIVPGKAAESLLWKNVAADEMPEDRPPLSASEKNLLRQWIDDGAAWSLDEIDRATYAPQLVAGANWIRRLTVPEYIETVRAATGVDIADDAQRFLPRDLRADGFSNTAYNLTVDLGHVEAYARLAQIIVAKLDTGKFAARFTNGQKLDDGNMRRLIAAMGKWLLRGPLDAHEVDTYLRVSNAVAAEGGDFNEAAGYIIEAMLQSPRFIYRIEKQRGDDDARPLDNYELANRLSYILWGGPPDEQLFRAADAGELTDRDRLASQVRRMLADPRAVGRSMQFAYEWLDLGRLDNLRPNAQRFPSWSPELASDMRDETLAFFRHVVWEKKRPLRDLFNAQVTFASPRLAEFYGLEARHIAATDSNDKTRPKPRSSEGLQALYTFEEGGGSTVRDVAGVGEPMHLTIESANAVEWGKGQLTVRDATVIATPRPPKRFIDAAKKTNEATLEAWVTPANTEQTGPARILTLSSDTSNRSFTLGQDGDKYEIRFRTTKTDRNGHPAVTTARGSAQTRLTHIVYTRDVTGRAKVYIDGELVAAGNVDGILSNWEAGFRFAIGNEITKDRTWRGTFHRVALYSRALSPQEINERGAGVSQYDLAAVPARGGLLTQGSILTVGGDDASMVTRGLFVLHDVVRGHVDDPPPGLDTSPVPPKPGESRRAIAMKRINNPSCGGCHSTFEPFAFGLEKFNGIGAWSPTDEHGNKLRDDGEILFPESDKPIKYESSAQLMDLLAASGRVQETITWKLAQWALGRPMDEVDAPMLAKIHEQAKRDGGTYASTVTAIVMSDLVRMTRTE